MVRSSLATLGLTVAVVGFVLFAALGVGAWAAKAEADRRVEAVAARADAAAEAAARGVGLLREVIDRSETELHVARAARPDPGGPRPDMLTRMVVDKAVSGLPGGLDRAREVVGTASEAVRVAEAALAVFAEHPTETSALGVREGELDTARGQLRTASSDLGKARGVLGVTGATNEDQLSAVGEALARARDVADRLDETLTRARASVENARRLSRVWSLRAAVAATVLAAIGAAGQVFMARACWRTLRRGRVVEATPPG